MRLFVAIDLPESAKATLQTLSCRVAGARWTPAGQHHLTLRFIGEADDSRLKLIHECLSKVCSPPFFVHLRGVGFFPPRRLPRVIWVGAECSERMRQLHRQIESCLACAGLAPEGQKFVPHVTLARLSNAPASEVEGFLLRHGEFSVPQFQVNAFRLYRSILGSSGAKHCVEREYPLLGQTKKRPTKSVDFVGLDSPLGGDERI